MTSQEIQVSVLNDPIKINQVDKNDQIGTYPKSNTLKVQTESIKVVTEGTNSKFTLYSDDVASFDDKNFPTQPTPTTNSLVNVVTSSWTQCEIYKSDWGMQTDEIKVATVDICSEYIQTDCIIDSGNGLPTDAIEDIKRQYEHKIDIVKQEMVRHTELL